MSVCNAVTIERFDVESSVTDASLASSGQVHISRSSGHGQGHRNIKAFAGGLPSIERQSCYVFTISWQLSVSIPACLSCLAF